MLCGLGWTKPAKRCTLDIFKWSYFFVCLFFFFLSFAVRTFRVCEVYTQRDAMRCIQCWREKIDPIAYLHTEKRAAGATAAFRYIIKYTSAFITLDFTGIGFIPNQSLGMHQIRFDFSALNRSSTGCVPKFVVYENGKWKTKKTKNACILNAITSHPSTLF